MLLRVAFEYGHISWALATKVVASDWDSPLMRAVMSTVSANSPVDRVGANADLAVDDDSRWR
jgi:hypothetical protein